jgi:hypothetical protein
LVICQCVLIEWSFPFNLDHKLIVDS